MRVLLHAGHHKSGTTTIQELLKSQFGQPVAGDDWYPPPGDRGPGHADLVFALLGADEGKLARSKIGEIIRAGEECGIRRLLLSSELFSLAWPSRLPMLRELLDDLEVELIFTLTPIMPRAISFWKETVKHGSQLSLEQSFVAQMAGYSASMYSDFIDQIRPTKTTLVMVDTRGDPALLLRDFWKVAQLDDRKLAAIPKSEIRLNVSLGLAEIEIIRTLNTVLQNHESTGAPIAARFLMNEIFSNVLWREFCPRLEPSVPAPWPEVFQNLSKNTRAVLLPLVEAGTVNLVGSLDDL